MAESTLATPGLAPDRVEGQDRPAVVVPGEAGGRRRHHGLRAIEAPAPGIRRWLAELWRFRPAVGYYLISYMRKRYGRTFLGYIWLFLPVVIPLLLSSIVFGGILGVSVPGVPYFLYFLVTSAVWSLFAMTAYFGTRNLEITRSNLRKLYVPRLVTWIASPSLAMITFTIYAILGVGTILYYVIFKGKFYLQIRPETLLMPVSMVMVVAFGLAVALWFSPLAPRARDVRRTAGYVLGMWYFITPVIYPIEKIPSSYRFLAELNPVTAPIELFKLALLNVGDVTTTGLISWAVGLVLLGTAGLRFYLTKERRDVAWYY